LVYLEFHIKGGGSAIIEASMIGAAMSSSTDIWAVGTPNGPTRIILRSGETIDIVGNSAGGVIGRIVDAKAKLKVLKGQDGREVYLDQISPLSDPDNAG
jgi:hypothetical protein